MIGGISEHMARKLVNKLEEMFVGYRFKQVAIHLNEIALEPTYVLESFKQTFGIKHSRIYREIEQIVRFEHKFTYTNSYINIHHGQVTEYYFVELAVDDNSKTVYWKGAKEKVDLEYEYSRLRW